MAEARGKGEMWKVREEVTHEEAVDIESWKPEYRCPCMSFYVKTTGNQKGVLSRVVPCSDLSFGRGTPEVSGELVGRTQR